MFGTTNVSLVLVAFAITSCGQVSYETCVDGRVDVVTINCSGSCPNVRLRPFRRLGDGRCEWCENNLCNELDGSTDALQDMSTESNLLDVAAD